MNKYIALILIFIITFTLFPSFLPEAIGQPPPPPPEDIPLDGGLLFLIAAGVLYGGRKLYKSEKNKNIE